MSHGNVGLWLIYSVPWHGAFFLSTDDSPFSVCTSGTYDGVITRAFSGFLSSAHVFLRPKTGSDPIRAYTSGFILTSDLMGLFFPPLPALAFHLDMLDHDRLGAYGFRSASDFRRSLPSGTFHEIFHRALFLHPEVDSAGVGSPCQPRSPGLRGLGMGWNGIQTLGNPSCTATIRLRRRSKARYRRQKVTDEKQEKIVKTCGGPQRKTEHDGRRDGSGVDSTAARTCLPQAGRASAEREGMTIRILGLHGIRFCITASGSLGHGTSVQDGAFQTGLCHGVHP